MLQIGSTMAWAWCKIPNCLMMNCFTLFNVILCHMNECYKEVTDCDKNVTVNICCFVFLNVAGRLRDVFLNNGVWKIKI